MLPEKKKYDLPGTALFWLEKQQGKHPTQKPLQLLERIVLASTEPGQLILDPFSGSGTTGVAAARHGRRYVGMEMNEEYLDLSIRRYEAELPEEQEVALAL